MSTMLKMLHIQLAFSLLLGCVLTLIGVYILQYNGWVSTPAETNAESKTVDTENVGNLPSATHFKNTTIMLIWLWPFSLTDDLNVCHKVKVEGCLLTADRNLYSKADAVVFHHVDIKHDLSNMPKSSRPFYQKWIWMNLEPPTYSPRISGLNNLFNMTINYRQDSDIHAPYGFIIPSDSEKTFIPPKKDKLACWVVSHWIENQVRVKYISELQKHITVSTFGRAFQKQLKDNELLTTISSCKFYLAFENSIHKDYITEKIYNSFFAGTVPVVLGPPRKNYEIFLQGDSFIHVDDFKTPKELADYLLLLDKNEEMYLKYFEWRRHFKIKRRDYWPEHTCLACTHMRSNTQYKTLNNIESWFWDE